MHLRLPHRRERRSSAWIILIAALPVIASVWLAVAVAGIGGGAERAFRVVAKSSLPHSGSSATTPPNVLVVFTDDQDAASLSVMPNVQRELVARGTTFSNALVSLPQCCPSRATLLSGQYAHNHGVHDNNPPHGGFAAFDGSNDLPVWLQRAGYRTGWVGKYLNGYGNPGQGNDPLQVPPGWTDWVAPANHTEYDMFGYTLNRNGTLHDHGAGPRTYQTDVLARNAEAFIRKGAASPQPFFLTVAPLAPHMEGARRDTHPKAPRNPRPAPRDLGHFNSRPLPHPPSFNERNDADKTSVITNEPRLGRHAKDQLTRLYRSRLESLLAVDRMVGRLVAELRRTGQLQNTMIVYTSDQGFLLGEHHLIGKNRLYEEAVHVPLVMRGPGIQAGATRDQVVGNVDLAPTIVDATGARAGLRMDGQSLLGVASGAHPEDHRPLLLELFHGGRFKGVRTARWAYLDFGNRGVELYDMRADPYQLRNRASEPAYQGVRARMAALLDRLRACSGSGVQLIHALRLLSSAVLRTRSISGPETGPREHEGDRGCERSPAGAPWMTGPYGAGC